MWDNSSWYRDNLQTDLWRFSSPYYRKKRRYADVHDYAQQSIFRMKNPGITNILPPEKLPQMHKTLVWVSNQKGGDNIALRALLNTTEVSDAIQASSRQGNPVPDQRGTTMTQQLKAQ